MFPATPPPLDARCVLGYELGEGPYVDPVLVGKPHQVREADREVVWLQLQNRPGSFEVLDRKAIRLRQRAKERGLMRRTSRVTARTVRAGLVE